VTQVTIATARLRLRTLAGSDLALFRYLYTDAEVMRFIGRPLSASEAAASFRATLAATRGPQGPRFFAIVEKHSGRAVGLCSIQPVEMRERSAEIGIMLGRAARRRYYASEALAALVAAAWRTLPIDTVWVQYRRANEGAARLFDALGFSKTDGWRPRGARPGLCVNIVQRPAWRMQSHQPERGLSMSNVIGFLENVGRNAALRHAERTHLLQAMQNEDISSTVQDALLNTSRTDIDALLGVRDTLYCSNFPVKTPKKAPAKKPVKAPPKKAPAKKPAKAPAKRGGKK
jgi:RimJ/RimL family protein N-acetyltransferase